MSFDWQTDEDNDWDDQSWQENTGTTGSPKPPWRTILIIVVLLSVVGVIVYRQVNERLDETTSAAEADIFAAHNLLSRAAANQDGELGKAVLSGRDMGWSRVQTRLIDDGLFYENPVFGLPLANGAAAYEPLFREDERFINLDLEPSLNGAELSYARDYLAFTEDGLQTVTLQQTAVYRRGETRWLLSPPLEAFWGAWQLLELENVTYIYPKRDEEIMEQLASDLSSLLTDICAALPELDCSPDLQIRFDIDPESLLEAADSANLYNANLRLNLPTPTLVGLPINDDGYEALLYAYVSKMVAAFISYQAAYDCCSSAPLFQAVLTYQLSELGLAAWPVTQDTQRDLANAGVHTELVFPFWSATEFTKLSNEESLQLFGFVDFLFNHYAPHWTALELMEHMNSSRTYQSWLLGLSEETAGEAFGALDSISRDWWFYALTQAEAAAVARQPISLPAQDLQVGCFNPISLEDTPQTTLYRYQLGSDTWREEFLYPGLAFFNPLPQDDGVILQLIEVSEEQYWQTLLWQNGHSVELMNSGDVYAISLGQMDPNGRFLLSYFGAEEDQFLPNPLLIDMESCRSGICARTALTQTPHWSPDSQWLLLSDLHLFETGQYRVDGRIISLSPDEFDEISSLSLRAAEADPSEAVIVDQGISPFWISDEQFGYIRPLPDAGRPVSQELVVASIANLEPQTVLTTADLDEALADRITSSPLVMQYAIAHPTNQDLLLVMVSTQARESQLMLLNRQTQEISTLFQLDVSRGEHSLGFSPDGRFVVATGSMRREISHREEMLSFGAMHLYDFETGKEQTVLINTEIFFPAFTFDWSMDSNWLAFTRDKNVIGLMAPAYDYQQMILHEEGDCASLAWINPPPPE